MSCPSWVARLSGILGKQIPVWKIRLAETCAVSLILTHAMRLTNHQSAERQSYA